MVEHLICNEEMAVRFCLGPPKFIQLKNILDASRFLVRFSQRRKGFFEIHHERALTGNYFSHSIFQYALGAINVPRAAYYADHPSIDKEKQEALEIENQGAGFVVLYEFDPQPAG